MLHSVVTDEIDDASAALAHHDRQRIAQAAHVTHEFQLHRLRPIGLREVLDDAAGCGAGIVDQDVDAGERLMTFLDEILGIGILGQIGGNGDDLASGLLGDLCRGGLELVLAARAYGNVDAFTRQRSGDAFADALATAGHERRLAFELKVHDVSSISRIRSTSLWPRLPPPRSTPRPYRGRRGRGTGSFPGPRTATEMRRSGNACPARARCHRRCSRRAAGLPGTPRCETGTCRPEHCGRTACANIRTCRRTPPQICRAGLRTARRYRGAFSGSRCSSDGRTTRYPSRTI